VNNLRAYPIYLGIKGSFALFFTLWATVAAVYRIEVDDPLRLVLHPPDLQKRHEALPGRSKPERRGKGGVARQKRPILAGKEQNLFNPDEIYRNFVDV